MADAGVVEFVILGTTRDGKPFRPFVYPITANGVRCVVVDVRLDEIEPMAYRFLVNFAKDNELQVRDGRVAERSRLAEMQRVGDTA